MKKPSNITIVKAKKAHFLLPSFRAITMFGTIFCNDEKDIELINKSDVVDSVLKCHETIHVRQAENTKNSWILFYLNYIWQWLCNIPLMFIKLKYAYMFIPYELEAFANETNYAYAYSKTDQWKMFKKKFSMKDKKAFAKRHKKAKMSFRELINTEIIPKINGED